MASPYNPTPDTVDEEPTVIAASKARGGSWGRHIFWILVISTTLAAAVLLISYAITAQSVDGPGPQSRSSDAEAFDTTQRTPSSSPGSPAP